MVTLFVGGHIGTIQGERDSLEGNRMFSAAWPPRQIVSNPRHISAYIDSGAFTEPPSGQGPVHPPEPAKKREFGASLDTGKIMSNGGSMPWPT